MTISGLPTTYYLQPTTYDLLPTTYNLLLTTYDLLPTTENVYKPTPTPRPTPRPKGHKWLKINSVMVTMLAKPQGTSLGDDDDTICWSNKMARIHGDIFCPADLTPNDHPTIIMYYDYHIDRHELKAGNFSIGRCHTKRRKQSQNFSIRRCYTKL